MRLSHLLTVPVATGAIILLGMSSASAGEAQGNSSAGNINETGMRGHANSICGFSGQNPERFLDPSDPNYEPGRTQSWGQIPKEVRDFLTTIGENPGVACNGHSGALAGGGGEP
jgi:hypothetical protein